MNPIALHSTRICAKEGACFFVISLIRNVNKKKLGRGTLGRGKRIRERENERQRGTNPKDLTESARGIISHNFRGTSLDRSLFFSFPFLSFLFLVKREREMGMSIEFEKRKVVVSPGSKRMKKRIGNHEKVKNTLTHHLVEDPIRAYIDLGNRLSKLGHRTTKTVPP